MGLKVILWFPQASQRWLPRLVAAIFMTHWTAAECRYKYKYKQWPELTLSASDIPLGESVPQLPSLFPTAHYHFTYRHQTSCYGEHKAKYLRVWYQRMRKCFQPRSCCCRGHWPLALAVAWCRVNKQSWPRQISRTELWTVPRSQLFTQPRPDLSSPEMDWISFDVLFS